MLASSSSSAQVDKVWIAPTSPTAAESHWYPKSIETLVGNVVRFDKERIEIMVQGENAPRRMAAYRVVWIEPAKVSQNQAAAIKLFADKNYTAAVKPLIECVDKQTPVWRQQWISMLAANASWRSSRSEIALEIVSQLDARPLTAYVLAWLPIAWESERIQAAAMTAAEQRIGDKSAAVRLVSSSWLMQSPSRTQAAAVLSELAVDRDRPVIAQLAETVLWRAAPPPEVIKKHSQWQERIAALPIVLQTGPTILLADKCEAAGLDPIAKKLKLMRELTPAIPYPTK